MTSVKLPTPLWPLLALAFALVVAVTPSLTARADGACPNADGWTRLVAEVEARHPDEPIPPWEREPLRNNGGSRQWLYAIAGGWEAPGVIYVGGQPGLYQSLDCGATWDMPHDPIVFGPPEPLTWIKTLAIAPGGRIYADGPGPSSSIHVSDDFGVTWRKTPGGAANGLEASPSDPEVAYIFGWSSGAPPGSHSAESAVMRTADGGRRWQSMGSHSQPGHGPLPFGVAIVDAVDPLIVYVIDPDKGIVYRSTDGAASFVPYSTFDANRAQQAHPAENAGDPPLWILWQGSFFVSRDRAVSWHRPTGFPAVVGTGVLPTGPITSITGDPHDPAVMYALVRGDEIWAYREPASSPLSR